VRPLAQDFRALVFIRFFCKNENHLYILSSLSENRTIQWTACAACLNKSPAVAVIVGHLKDRIQGEAELCRRPLFQVGSSSSRDGAAPG
jgi:hypothetical protein